MKMLERFFSGISLFSLSLSLDFLKVLFKDCCNSMSGCFPGISQSRISHWLLQHGSDLSEQKKRAFYRWYTLEKTTPGTPVFPDLLATSNVCRPYHTATLFTLRWIVDFLKYLRIHHVFLKANRALQKDRDETEASTLIIEYISSNSNQRMNGTGGRKKTLGFK